MFEQLIENSYRKAIVDQETLHDIASAIREKNGTDNTYKLSEMPQAIRDIEDVGFGSRQWWLDAMKSKNTCKYLFSNSDITSVPFIDTSNCISFYSMCEDCSNLIEFPSIDTSKGEEFNYMFTRCKKLSKIGNIDLSNAKTLNGMFSDCSELVTIPLIDASNITSFSTTFTRCTNLKNISFVENSINVTIAFYMSSLLTDESIQSIINGLADRSSESTTIKVFFHSIIVEKLTDEQRLQILNKNWELG